MANEQDKNPTTGQESDISKSQATQQPTTGQQRQQPELGQQGHQTEFGQDRSEDQADEGLQAETATQQRTDIEGSSLQPEKGEEGGFVGSESDADTSGELIDEEDEDFAKGGQGAPEDK
jgi:hypothetical protein